jgi:hypothetical protein
MKNYFKITLVCMYMMTKFKFISLAIVKQKHPCLSERVFVEQDARLGLSREELLLKFLLNLLRK